MRPRRAAKLVVAWYGSDVVFSNAWTDDGFPVMGRLVDVDGILRLQELKFLVSDLKSEIGSGTLRRIRLDEVVAQVRAAAAAEGAARARDLGDPEYVQRLSGHDGALDAVRAIVRAGRAAAKHPPAGSRGWGDDFYRMVAVEYVKLTEAGAAGRGVLSVLAERLAARMGESEPRDRDNVRDWVAEARRREFLVPLGRGRGGALPGPRLYDTEGDR